MKIILGVFVGAAVVVGFAMSRFWQDGLEQPPKFRTLPVTRGELFIGVTATGTVEPVETIDVGAQIVGSIRSFGPDSERPGKTIDFRSRVKTGQLLAQLDDVPHRAESDKAQAGLRLAEAELKMCQTKQKQMELAYRRAKELRATEPEAEFEKAEAEYEMATAEVAMAGARVERGKIALREAENNLGYTKICSPVDGVVIDRRVNVGQTVVAGMNAPSLFLLAKDLSHMLVWAAVNEADIGEIHLGQAVTFTVDAFRDRKFTGKVSQIRLNASLQQNVVIYGVIVEVDNADGKLLPYMTAKLQFEVNRRPKAVLVPNQALRWRPQWNEVSPHARGGLKPPRAPAVDAVDDGADDEEEDSPKVDLGVPTLWIVAGDGFVRPVRVKAGLSDGMVTEILDGGVKPGDEVVVNVVKKAQPDFVSSFVSKVTSIGQ